MPQTKDERRESAAVRTANKRSAFEQLRHLDAHRYAAVKERAKLQLELQKQEP
jgi:hypothetical protein